jgi:hemerythrin
VVEIQKDYQAGRKGISLEILSFLQEWLSVHILQTDREIGRFLVSSNRIQTPGRLKDKIDVG